MTSSQPEPPSQRQMNPIPGTTIDTSPDTLGFSTSSQPEHEDSGDPSATLFRSPSGSFVRRTVERTMEKLSRGGSRLHTTPKPEDNKGSGPRRLFSLTRRSKDHEQATAQELGGGEQDRSIHAPGVLTLLHP